MGDWFDWRAILGGIFLGLFLLSLGWKRDRRTPRERRRDDILLIDKNRRQASRDLLGIGRRS